MFASRTRLLTSSAPIFSNQGLGSVCRLQRLALASPRATYFTRATKRPETHARQAPPPLNKMILSNETNGTARTTSREYSSDAHPDVETEFLIAGAGPAGASLACFLTSYGTIPGCATFLEKILTNVTTRFERNHDQRGTRNGQHPPGSYYKHGGAGYVLILPI